MHPVTFPLIKALASLAIQVSEENIIGVQGNSEHQSPTDQAVKEIWEKSQLESMTRDFSHLSLNSSQFDRFEKPFTQLSSKIDQACSEEELPPLLNTLQTKSSEFIHFALENVSEPLIFSKVFVQLINLWNCLCTKATTSKHECVIQMATFGIKCIPLVRKDIAAQLQEMLELLTSITPSHEPSDFSLQHWIVPLSYPGREFLNVILPSLQNDDQLLTIIYLNLIKASCPMDVAKARPLLPAALCTAVDIFTTKLEKYFHISSYKTFVSFVDNTISAQVDIFLGRNSVAVTFRKERNSDTLEIAATWMGWSHINYDEDMLPYFSSMTGIPLKTRTLRKESLEAVFETKNEEQIVTVCRVINDITEEIIDSNNKCNKYAQLSFEILSRILHNLSPTCSQREIEMQILDEVLKRFKQTNKLPCFFLHCYSEFKKYPRKNHFIDEIVTQVSKELTNERFETVDTPLFFHTEIFFAMPEKIREKIYERYFLGYKFQFPQHSIYKSYFDAEDYDLQNRVYESLCKSCITTTKTSPDYLLKKPPVFPYGRKIPLDFAAYRNSTFFFLLKK